MRESITRSTTRREFIKTAAFSAGALLAGGCAHLRAPGKKSPAAIRWALMADIHISRNEKETNRNFIINDGFKTAVAQITQNAPEGVVIAGDLARLRGELGDYEVLKRLLEPLTSRMTVALALGNHDNRANFYKVFGSQIKKPSLVKGKHVQVIETGGLRLITLDSQLAVDVVSGLLGKAQRDWLEKYLDQSDRRPTFVFLHHNLGDRDGDLLDTDRFLKIILPRKQVKAVFYGHSHEYHYDQINGLHLINLPAVAYNFSDKEPVGWVEARLSADGGDFTLHAFAGNRQDDGKTVSLRWRE